MMIKSEDLSNFINKNLEESKHSMLGLENNTTFLKGWIAAFGHMQVNFLNNYVDQLPSHNNFYLSIINIDDYKSYCIVDSENNKVVCHLVNENGDDYCIELGNKIVNILNNK